MLLLTPFPISRTNNHRKHCHAQCFPRAIFKITRTLMSLDFGRVRLWKFCVIKYSHNGPFNGPINSKMMACDWNRTVPQHMIREQMVYTYQEPIKFSFANGDTVDFFIVKALCRRLPWDMGCRTQNLHSNTPDPSTLATVGWLSMWSYTNMRKLLFYVRSFVPPLITL